MTCGKLFCGRKWEKVEDLSNFTFDYLDKLYRWLTFSANLNVS